MGPWITAADLKQALADLLKQDLAALAPIYDRVAAQAVLSGYADVSTILFGKGYTAGQLDAWDNRVGVSTDQSLWRAALLVGGLGEYADKFVTALDRRKELMDASTIMIGGVPVAPGGTDVGGISHGRVTAADCDALRFDGW
ncbi:hypothetical protein [Gemmata sp.]|uniref:hypothetical protein n=1 Tax=Gemmata sp. TaxID=1914242 RepID=UPI003F71C385